MGGRGADRKVKNYYKVRWKMEELLRGSCICGVGILGFLKNQIAKYFRK